MTRYAEPEYLLEERATIGLVNPADLELAEYSCAGCMLLPNNAAQIVFAVALLGRLLQVP